MLDMKEIQITDIEGFRIGNASDEKGGTGCTVIICEEGATASVSVLGGGPASRDTELLEPKMMVKVVHAVLLSGGSAYGLDAAGGVLKYLEERNIGFQVEDGVVPIVPSSALFDITVGDPKARPDAVMGYEACTDSEGNKLIKNGNAGAGTGATVGKFMGMKQGMKSGLGTYAVQIGDLKVGAIVAVNALGDVFDVDTGKEIAGMLDEKLEHFESCSEAMWSSVETEKNVFTGNTTIGCIITNAKLDKSQCSKLAEMTHDGYARAIRPVHTSADGDSIYYLAHGQVDINQDALGDLSAYVMAKAINKAVKCAEPAYGFKAGCDIR